MEIWLVDCELFETCRVVQSWGCVIIYVDASIVDGGILGLESTLQS